jgi:adenylylsulfate kinase-like enzyme
MIIVLFGQPHSGKTTIAKEFLSYRNIDGDKLRELFANKDYSREGRIRNLNRASDIAHYMNTEGDDVTLSLVYPYKEARDYLNGLTKDVAWVYLTYTDQRGRENFHVQDFELPTDENILHINTSATSLNDCLKLIDNYVRNHKS